MGLIGYHVVVSGPPFQRRRRSVAVAVWLMTAGALWPRPVSADIYVYKDADGVMHFSNVKRPGSRVYVRGKSRRKKRRSSLTPVMPADNSPARFARYDQTIREAATLYQIPEALIRAVIKVESNYDPRAVSVAGARGLMQIMPQTGLRMGVRDLFDPRRNILAGTRYLRVLANGFNGDLQLTVAGYNAGEGAVIRYGGIPPYRETQGYVVQVLAYYHRYRTMKDVALASRSLRRPR